MPAKKKKVAVPPNTAVIPPELFGRWVAARASKAQWEEIEKDARADIEALAKDNEDVVIIEDGKPRKVISWKFGKSRRLNQARLKERYPDIVEECTDLVETRTFKEVT